jgi:hypothetical protein
MHAGVLVGPGILSGPGGLVPDVRGNCSGVMSQRAGSKNSIAECYFQGDNLVGNLASIYHIGIVIELYPDPADPVPVNVQHDWK